MSPKEDNHRPLELVFVRHGESEGNVAVNAAENGDNSYFTEEFRSRHSSTWNLTPKGEEQAKAAGDWIKKNINGGIFDKYYASTYRRAKRTAGLLDLPGAKWRLRDYIREHDWGNLDVMTDEELSHQVSRGYERPRHQFLLLLCSWRRVTCRCPYTCPCRYHGNPVS